MALRVVRPMLLVDVNGIADLDRLSRDVDVLYIGAVVRHQQLGMENNPVLSGFDVLKASSRLVGHYPIRTRGTFCGSIAHADPAAEWCVLATLLDAQVVVAGPAGTRTVPVTQIFRGPQKTSLSPDEMIVQTRLPIPVGGASLVEHGQSGWAAVVAAARIERDGDLCKSVSIALGGVAPAPIRSADAEALLVGVAGSRESFDAAAGVASSSLMPPSDSLAGAAHRRRLAMVLVRRALMQAWKAAA